MYQIHTYHSWGVTEWSLDTLLNLASTMRQLQELTPIIIVAVVVIVIIKYGALTQELVQASILVHEKY